MNRFIVILCAFFLAVSCDTTIVKSDIETMPNGVWNKNQPVAFSFPMKDSLEVYDMFLTVRNTNDYKYSNLFLITRLDYPNGKVITDTLEYKMANPDGSWLGTGIGNTKESKLWFKPDIQFNEPGAYNLLIEHAVRNNGEVNGVSNLEGITDVGYSIEKQTKE